MGSICKIFEKDGWLFETHSFTNSTSGEENLQKLREIIAKKKTKILGIQDQFELHKQSLLEDREKMKKEIEALKQQSQYEVKSSVRRVIEFLLCFEWSFTRTFPGNQDVAVKQKFDVKCQILVDCEVPAWPRVNGMSGNS